MDCEYKVKMKIEKIAKTIGNIKNKVQGRLPWDSCDLHHA